MKNLINFQIRISQSKLSSLVTKAIDEAIGEDSLEVESFQVTLKRIDKVNLYPDQKNIRLELPYDVHLFKQTGLFSVDGKGAIKLILDVEYDISSDLVLSTKTTLYDYSWIAKPEVDLGIVNVPLEKVLDMVINKYNPVITEKIDEKLKEFSNIRTPLTSLDAKIAQQISNADFKGIHPSIELCKVNMIPIESDGGVLKLQGSAEPSIVFNDVKTYSNIKDVKFEWIETLEEDYKVQFSAIVSYDFIVENILKNISNVEIAGKPLKLDNLNINQRGGRLSIKADILQPITAKVSIEGNPSFEAEVSIIHLDDIEVNVKPSSFIYKMTTPIVNSFIKNKLTSMFPMSTDTLIKERILPMIPREIPYPMGVFNVSFENINIENILFEETGLDVIAGVSQLMLNTYINEEE